MVRTLAFVARSRLANTPSLWGLYQPYLWWDFAKSGLKYGWDDPREHRLRPSTALVIDGFQGSANSYAVDVFKLAQPVPVELSHHMHSATQIVRAVERGLPTVVCLRAPREAVLSLTSRWPHVPVVRALESYIQFHERLAPHAAGCVISPFEWTTQRFDEVVEEVNRRFGTRFASDVYRPELAASLARTTQERSGTDAARAALKQQHEQDLQQPACRALLARAEAAYQALLPFALGAATPASG